MVIDNAHIGHGYSMVSKLRQQGQQVFGTPKPADPPLAKRIFQVVFAGFDGSTFPVGYWPVNIWNSVDILSTVLEANESLDQFGFKVLSATLIMHIHCSFVLNGNIYCT